MKNQQQFMKVVQPLLMEHNQVFVLSFIAVFFCGSFWGLLFLFFLPVFQLQRQVNWGPALYRLAKALWFKHLDPDIVQAALDKGEGEEEEDYDEYDENLYEDYEDTEREGDKRSRRREAAYEEEEYLEESVVPGPSQAAGQYLYETDEVSQAAVGGYIYEADEASQEGGEGEYVYEADEEGEDWEEGDEEGDYEDYGEVVQAEYEGVYQGEYFEGEVNQAQYYAGSNHYDGANNLYEDIY